jgi:hypothetical protein
MGEHLDPFSPETTVANYAFVTNWEVDAPIESVWDAIAHPREWPQWWRGVERVIELEPGDSTGLGSLRRFTFRSRLPYALTFDMRSTRIVHHELLEGRAIGELEGMGRWTFAPAGATTRVRYDWQVQTTKRWMELLAPIARPVFEWNHDVIMAWGLDGLRRRVAVPDVQLAYR